jgi:hypothetical protein
LGQRATLSREGFVGAQSEFEQITTKEYAFRVAVKNVRWQQFKPEEKEYMDHAK